jgi:hypothetical protein
MDRIPPFPYGHRGKYSAWRGLCDSAGSLRDCKLDSLTLSVPRAARGKLCGNVCSELEHVTALHRRRRAIHCVRETPYATICTVFAQNVVPPFERGSSRKPMTMLTPRQISSRMTAPEPPTLANARLRISQKIQFMRAPVPNVPSERQLAR